MVGYYSDPPAQRMAYDRDGTQLAYISSGGSITAFTQAQRQALNNELTDGSPLINPGSGGMIAFIFPERRDIVKYFQEWNALFGAAWIVESSVDTTNGYDGTWATVNAAITPPTLLVQPNYRISSAWNTPTGNNTNIKAIRWRNSTTNGGFCPTIHLYGTKTNVTDRLELWHPTLNQPLSDTPAYFDYGDQPRNQTVNKTFRVKNRSTTLTAGSITVSREALTDSASPTHVSEITLSYDGGSFASTAALSSLAPGAISNLFTVRQTFGATSVLGLWAQRLVASAGSWT